MMASRRFARSYLGRRFFMWLFYLDESGNPEPSGPSKCYILAAVGIPVYRWAACDKAINQLKYSYNMPDAEIHTAWMLRDYKEQSRVEGFKDLSHEARRAAVIREREKLIERKKSQDGATNKDLKNIRKNFKNTDAYVHLTHYERQSFIRDLAGKFKGWKNVRLFAEIIEKEGYRPPRAGMSMANQAFERIVMRIETFLAHISTEDNVEYGLLIHDQCESLIAPHTANMKRYHRVGTFKSKVKHIIETPLFVESSRAGMVQVADLCAYALRRYYDSGDTELFDVIKNKADRIDNHIVGMCHYIPAGKKCACELCQNRKRYSTP